MYSIFAGNIPGSKTLIDYWYSAMLDASVGRQNHVRGPGFTNPTTHSLPNREKLNWKGINPF
jgi:hypothetical protein